MPDTEIAGYTARWHSNPVPAAFAPPGLGGQALGAVGIPSTRIPGIAANFGQDGVIRVPRSVAVQAIPASRVAPLIVNESGLLAPGR